MHIMQEYCFSILVNMQKATGHWRLAIVSMQSSALLI